MFSLPDEGAPLALARVAVEEAVDGGQGGDPGVQVFPGGGRQRRGMGAV